MQYANLPPNRRIKDFIYNEQAFLGEGAFGKVYLGHPINDKKKIVAIKKMSKSKFETTEMQKILQNELKILSILKGNHTCGSIDQCQTGNNQYIIQPFCSQGDMRKYLTRRNNRIPENEAIIILQQILMGMQEMVDHDLVHRDLKPENILIDNNVFKVADYGFSTWTQGKPMNTQCGTPIYMSPQIHQGQPYTNKCDIWAIGMIYYEMLCGQTPWQYQQMSDLVNMPKRYPIRFPHDIDISIISRRFIRGCLQFEEKNRLSWQEIFQSPIFLNPVQKRIIPKAINDERLKNYIIQIQKHIHIMNIDVNQIFTQFDKSGNNMLEFEEFFSFLKSIDPDIDRYFAKEFFDKTAQNNHHVNIFEFQDYFNTDYEKKEVQNNVFLNQMRQDNCIKHLVKKFYQKGYSIDQVILKYDVNGDNQLQPQELHKFLLSIDHELTREESDSIFNAIDIDQNQAIDFNEFQQFINLKARQNGFDLDNFKINGNADRNLFISIVKKNNINLGLTSIKYDFDRNGVLDFDEFLSLCKKIEKTLQFQTVKQIFEDLSEGKNYISFQTLQEISY